MKASMKLFSQHDAIPPTMIKLAYGLQNTITFQCFPQIAQGSLKVSSFPVKYVITLFGNLTLWISRYAENSTKKYYK